MKTEIFETVSFHIVKPCNMACKFCYATFNDMHVKQINIHDVTAIIGKLAAAGVKKITFAGGEPMLYKHIKAAIWFAKDCGLNTCIVTNGSLLKEEWLDEMRPCLDWVGLSIDSVNEDTNIKTGRAAKGAVPDYFELVSLIRFYGYKLKINTVVNAYNWTENMRNFIKFAKPERWKIFQALRVEGQNDDYWNQIKVTSWEFISYINLHSDLNPIVENNAAMTGSYLLIDPQGRLFENSAGRHTYSDPVQDFLLSHCLSQIKLNRKMFIKRGGLYQW